MTKPADGDRKDLGGKIPQFKAFAEFAYGELNAGNLEWIRVADPEAATLDDIQYATPEDIHAYQVKWSNLDKPEPFSYTDLKNLLPDLVTGWKKLKDEYINEHKKLFVHLLTNRQPSINDHVKDSEGNKIGNFKEFLAEVWIKLKSKTDTAPRWKAVADEFLQLTTLTGDELAAFLESCNITTGFVPYGFGVGKKANRIKNQDLLKFFNYLLERVIDTKKQVHFTAQDLIEGLEWESRFETHFNHELIVDPLRYRPIARTTDALDALLGARSCGYIFLAGGPGSGKSSLLAQWSKAKQPRFRVIRYYAFDFIDPASLYNNSTRGEATSLFFDMVQQLRAQNIGRSDTLIQDDPVELRKIFSRQLAELGRLYAQDGQPTLIVIDGLDHIPREYNVTTSLLSELPAPDALPDGVTIILGSQTYELENLQPDVKTAWQKNDSNINMSPLPKEEVFRYVEESELTVTVDNNQKQMLFDISQGHPLYLSYLVNRIKETNDLEFLKDEIAIDGDIERLYNKYWDPIKDDTGLVNFMGLIARVNGDINFAFIKEWKIEDVVTRAFKTKTFFLFRQGDTGLQFFHNSFRRFLIIQSALNPLDDTYDKSRDENFHLLLAKYYEQSTTEPGWNKLRHLFLGGDHEKFIADATPDMFAEQFLNFRSDEEIKNDIRLGLRISKERHDPYLTMRYLFALSELETRKRYATSNSFIKEFLRLGEFEIAGRLTRKNNRILVGGDFALQLCADLFELNQHEEAKLLFALAEPECISSAGIMLPPLTYDRHIYKTLRRWAVAATLVMPLDILLDKVKNISHEMPGEEESDPKTLAEVKSMMMLKIAFTLLKQKRIGDLEKVLGEFGDTDTNKEVFFQEAVMICHRNNDDAAAAEWLKRYEAEIAEKDIDEDTKLILANLIMLTSGNLQKVKELIKGIEQPTLIDERNIPDRNGFAVYKKRLLLNKLLNITRQGQSITKAVPDSADEDESVFVDFERKLCMMAQLSADACLGIPVMGDFEARVRPIISYFYQPQFANGYNRKSYKWHKLTTISSDYFKVFVSAVAGFGSEKIQELSEIFFKEFSAHPQKWSAARKRSVLMDLYEYGCRKDAIVKQLEVLELTMLHNKDITGRTEEAYAQAEAWTQLDEKERAMRWMEITLQQTIGIGYTKDNQFYGWVEWLQRYLSTGAPDAMNAIASFANFLPHIKQTTELSTTRTATRALLNATFQYNSVCGLNLMEWTLRSGLIDFESALAICLKDQFNKIADPNDYVMALAVYKTFYLFIANLYQRDLLKEMLRKGAGLLPDSFLEQQLPELIEGVRINTLSEKRQQYFIQIHEFLVEQGKSPAEIKEIIGEDIEIKKTSRENVLNLLVDHKQLSEEEVMSVVHNGKDLLIMLKGEDKANSWFKWNNVIDKIENTVTIEDLELIGKLNFSGKRHSELLAHLSVLAFRLGDKIMADKLVHLSLQQSSAMGWNPGYDGGSRINAFKALQQIDHEHGYHKALDTLIEDTLESDYGNDYIDNLDDILPVITEKPDIQKAWPEINAYVQRLMANNEIADRDKFALTAEKERLILPELLKVLYFNGITSLKNRTRNLIVLSLETDDKTQGILTAMASGSEHEQEGFLQTVELYSCRHGENLSRFKKELLALSVSQNIWIRRSARRLIITHLKNTEIPEIPKNELSPVYRFILPVTTAFTPINQPARDSSVRDTDNLLELISPYGDRLETVSEATGLDSGAILQRWVQIMKENYAVQITADFEKAFKEYLIDTDLKFPFSRPRVQAARNALGRLLAELEDAGELTDDDLLNYPEYDYYLDSETKVRPRPLFIQKIKNGQSRFPSEEWVNAIVNDPRFLEKIKSDNSNWTVIGEYSVSSSLDWGKPQEIVTIQLVFAGELPFEKEKLPFANVFDRTVNEYFSRLRIPQAPYIVIQNGHGLRNSGLEANWLALNPTIGFRLNWHPSAKGSFAWENDEGNLMAESVFWRDGNSDMNPPHPDSEAGEGWYVRISPEGLQLLKTLSASAILLNKKITREWHYEENFASQSDEQVTEMWE